MRRLLLSAAAAALVAGPAIAADMPAKAPLYKALPPPIVYNWTGLYIGVHGGGAWAKETWTSDWNCTIGIFCDTISNRLSGGVFGGQVGVRWQGAGSWVIGIEGTGAWARLRETQNGLHCITGVGGCGIIVGSPNLTYFKRLDGLWTATAQLGYAWDRTLFYAKGGWAGTRITRNLSSFAPAGTLDETTGDLKQNATGWTVGAGLEYMWTRNFSVGIEYDYFRLSAGAVTSNSIPGVGFVTFVTHQSSTRDNISELLVRANYRFDWAGPVRASY